MKNKSKFLTAMRVIAIIAIAAITGFSIIGCKKSEGSQSASGSVSAAVSSNGTSSTASSGSGSAARFLDEYEKFINESLSIIQKMMTGDADAMLQAESLEARLDDMVEKFNNLSDSDFTPAQLLKYEELTDKFTNAFSF